MNTQEFNAIQETAKAELIERINTNSLNENDIKLFSDMLENSTLVHGCGFNIGTYALAYPIKDFERFF